MIANKKAYVYLGPNLQGGKLHTGSVYTDEPPKHLINIFEKIPDLRELFVEAKEAHQFKKDILSKGTEAERLYQSVSLEVREGIR